MDIARHYKQGLKHNRRSGKVNISDIHLALRGNVSVKCLIDSLLYQNGYFFETDHHWRQQVLNIGGGTQRWCLGTKGGVWEEGTFFNSPTTF